MSHKAAQGRRANLSGNTAEETAARHYRAQGYTILEQRYRGIGGEIDLIVSSDTTLIFVEVKSRRSLQNAAASVSPAQWQRIMASALAYVAETSTQKTHPQEPEMRFDLFAIDEAGTFEVIQNVTQDF